MIFTTPHSGMLNDFWVIRSVDNTAADHRPLIASPDSQYGMQKEYRISDLAYYLMNPNPITVQKKLIGCEIRYKKPACSLWAQKLGKAFPYAASRKRAAKETPPEILMARPGIATAFSRDVDFKHHLERLDESLRPYDAMVKSLQEKDKSTIEDIIGICEEPDGNHSRLALKGDIEDKVQYMNRFFNHEVDVVLKSAQIADNYFEIKGFDFKTFNPENRFHLTLFHNGMEGRACVLNRAGNLEYWLTDVNLIKYMLLLEQAIKGNDAFRTALDKCMRGDAFPLKIFFNKKFEVDYSQTHLPKAYKDAFDLQALETNQRSVLTRSLNQLQLGIAFIYAAGNEDDHKIYTNISVMHNIEALEPVRMHLPQVYSEIEKRISSSRTGRFYLLDAMEGSLNA